jgi:hypothetical protein
MCFCTFENYLAYRASSMSAALPFSTTRSFSPLSSHSLRGVSGRKASRRKPIRFERWELLGETILRLISALHQKRPPPCRTYRWP